MDIKDLDRRLEFWSKMYLKKDQGPTEIGPFEGDKDFSHLFVGKDVLEIGPGEGRQYEKVADLAKSYAIADIVPDVLQEEIYKDVDNKYLLENDYPLIGLNNKFDVIHCWYVVHHILKEELCDFFSFVSRHLKWGGTFMFNFPLYKEDNKERFMNDGTKTVGHEELYILKILLPLFAYRTGFTNNTEGTLILQGKLKDGLCSV